MGSLIVTTRPEVRGCNQNRHLGQRMLEHCDGPLPVSMRTGLNGIAIILHNQLEQFSSRSKDITAINLANWQVLEVKAKDI